ncbi:MAG: YaiI/YqxD family protein, partial [Pseudomonadota bacterium]
MKIWIDADACPAVIKEILFRAAERTKRHLMLIANHPVYIPPSPFIRMYQVESGFNVADNEIIKRLDKGDLVITSDIPLAAEVIKKEGVVLSPRGELYTKENIDSRLSMRNFMENLRA